MYTPNTYKATVNVRKSFSSVNRTMYCRRDFGMFSAATQIVFTCMYTYLPTIYSMCTTRIYYYGYTECLFPMDGT